ncbi:MAG: OmpA family protein [Deltaproteobacteria bacterium]|nr:OmpA family protein [Deltaproteobacteria bacterium]
MRKNKRQEEDEKVDRWMVSYADFVTLLFAFFVVMYALSTLNESKYKILAESVSKAFKAQRTESVIPELMRQDAGPLFADAFTKTFTGDFRKIHHALEGLEKAGIVSLNVERRGVVISMADKFVFDSGKADIRSDAEAVLDEVGKALKDMPNQIKVEGHTDNVPINTPQFPSNWELSSARALNILKYLVAKHDINPVKVSATGYSEFRPVAPNDNPVDRAQNRRVDVVVLNESAVGE